MEALTHQLEYLFLKRLIVGLREGTMTVEQAKQYANEYLTVEPFSSAEDAYIKNASFVDQHPEFIELENYLEIFEKEKDVPAKIQKMREHIKQNNIEAALQVAKS